MAKWVYLGMERKWLLLIWNLVYWVNYIYWVCDKDYMAKDSALILSFIYLGVTIVLVKKK